MTNFLSLPVSWSEKLDFKPWSSGEEYTVVLFYRYTLIDEPNVLVDRLKATCNELHLLGRILISNEGVNGTLAGSSSSIESFVRLLGADRRFEHVDWKYSTGRGEHLPFLGLSIREVDEIVSTGSAKDFIRENIEYDLSGDTYGGIVGTGTHLTSSEFHEAVCRRDGIVLDVRNDFEHDIGHFEGALKLGTFTYAETFEALDRVVAAVTAKTCNGGGEGGGYGGGFEGFERIEGDGTMAKHGTMAKLGAAAKKKEGVQKQEGGEVGDWEKEGEKKSAVAPRIYMYCTGGIRCEKASAYLRAKGVPQVFQLEGGIHRYLETFPDGGAFHGKNFVFDSRVAVGPAGTRLEGETHAKENGKDEKEEEEKVNAMESKCDNQQYRFNSTAPGSGSGSGPGSAPAPAPGRTGVVGRCIDCSAAHDQYSGHVMCTVCRMPVLVCPACVACRAFPDEFHCSRHRDLKDLYFTVLERFGLSELQRQRTGLQELLQQSLDHSTSVATQRRDQRKTSGDRHRNLNHNTCSSGVATTDDSLAILGSASCRSLGKQRRRTLRKQIARIDQCILALQPGTNAAPTPVSVFNPQPDSCVPPAETAATYSACVPVSASPAAVDVDIPSTAPAAVLSATTVVAKGQPFEDPCLDRDERHNPQTRGGWGFWRS